jgi:hypothetical protein
MELMRYVVAVLVAAVAVGLILYSIELWKAGT